VIYSPVVPVFRNDRGELLPAAYPVSFLTAAALSRAAIACNQPKCLPEITTILARRARRVLRVAAAHGHRRLVLGAWGAVSSATTRSRWRPRSPRPWEMVRGSSG